MHFSYKTLFKIRLNHSYYEDFCRDVEFIPSGDTQRLFRNGKLLSRMQGGVLQVLFEAGEGGVPVSLIDGQILRFAVRASNPAFYSFTQLDETVDTLHKIRWTLDGATNQFIAESILLSGKNYQHQLTAARRPVTVEVLDASAAVIATQTLAAGTTDSSISFDLRNQAEGIYAVKESYTSSTVDSSLYIDDVLNATDMIGIVEVEILSSYYTSPPELNLSFQTKQDPWKYYIVAKNYSGTDINQLAIADEGFNIEGDNRTQLQFTKKLSGAFTSDDILPSQLSDNAAEVLLFESNAPVAWREKSRKKIQLKKNGDVLMIHLPNPSIHRPQPEIIIQLSKP
jgi:hypothetical protein